MTIHASKGLQAPIVILPDTTTLPINSSSFLWDDSGKVIWPVQSKYYNNYYKLQVALLKDKDYQEYLRLLYVAMTRAEDELIICGYSLTSNLSQDCWYSIIKESMSKISKTKKKECNLGFTSISKIVYDSFECNKINNINNYSYAESFNNDLLTYSPSSKVEFNDVLELKFLDTNLILPTCFSPLEEEYGINYGEVCHKILEDAVKSKNMGLLFKHPSLSFLTVKQRNKVKKTLIF